MTDNEKLIALCRTCVNSLNSVLDSNLPNNLALQLRQNLFMMEAAMQDFNTTSKDLQQTHDISKPESSEFEIPDDLKEATIEFEKDIILKAINIYGSKRKAANALNLDHSTLIKKCQRYGI